METRTVKERIVEMLRGGPCTKEQLLAQFEYERQQRGAASVVAYLLKTGQIEPDGDQLRLTGRAPAKPDPKPKRQAVVESEQPIETPQPTPLAEPPLEWALWHDGDLLIRRGEMTVVLTSEERKRIGEWMRKAVTA